jgi:hypothetical protein
VRGLGKAQPVVLTGDQDEQAINRRVEIKMRKNAPPEYDEVVNTLPKKPRIIKPLRNPNLPDSESDSNEDASPPPPKAIPVEENEQPLIAEPVPPRAVPVEDEPSSEPAVPVPPKAIPVE